MIRFFAAAVVAVLSVLAGGAGQAAENFAPAERLGNVDVSLFCPPGSSWLPLDGGACYGCPDHKKPTAGLCPGIEKARTARAKYSHIRMRFSPVCRPATFRKPDSRECWTCPAGFFRVPGVEFNRDGICYSPPHPVVRKAEVVLKISLPELLNPDRLKDEAADLGCKGYGDDAVFSPMGGGTCWQCPATHPQRTLYPVVSKRACGSASCGGLGERPCSAFAGEGLRACEPGLTSNPFKGECVARTSIVCKPLVAALGAMRVAVDKANAAGEGLRDGAVDKIPGFRELSAVMGGVTETMEDSFAGMVGKLPLDGALGDIDRMFESPREVEAMRGVLAAMVENRARLQRLLLDPDEVCDPEAQGLKRALTEIINAGAGQRRTEAAGTSWAAALGLVPEARAALSETVDASVLRGRGIQVAVMISVNVPKARPVVFGIVLPFRVGDDGRPTFEPKFAAGINLTGLPHAGHIGAVNVFGSFLPRRPDDKPPPFSVWLEVANLAGVNLDLGGLAAVNLRLDTFRADRVGDFFTAGAAGSIIKDNSTYVTKNQIVGPNKNVVLGLRGTIDLGGER